MISVLVLGFVTATGREPTSGDAVRTLGALVPSAVDGVVRDVVLLATTSDRDLARVADHAGCGYAAEPDFPRAMAAGAAQARSEHVLILLGGLSFDRALSDELAGVASRHVDWLQGGIGLQSVETGWLGYVLPRFAPSVGLLTSRSRIASPRTGDFPALVRDLRPRRFFKTRAWAGGV